MKNILDNIRIIFNQKQTKKYISNTGWIIAARAFSIVIAFFCTSIIARKLGTENYGALSYAISFVSIFSTIASLGLDNILYKNLIENKERETSYLGTSIFLKLISSLISIIILLIVSFFVNKEDQISLLIIIIAPTLFFQSFNLVTNQFFAKVDTKILSIISFGVGIFINILKIVFLYLGFGLTSIAYIVLFESIIYASFYIIAYNKKFNSIKKLNFDRSLYKDILKESLPLLFTAILGGIYARIDQVIIKQYLNNSSVGLYDSAVRLSEIWQFFPITIVGSLFPAIVNAKKISHELYIKRILSLTVLIFILSFSIALVTTLFSKTIIKIVFGDNFIQAYKSLILLSWSSVIICLNYIGYMYLITEKKTKINALSIFISVLLNIVLNILLIPKYGISGAALSTLIACLIPLIISFSNIFLNKNFRII